LLYVDITPRFKVRNLDWTSTLKHVFKKFECGKMWVMMHMVNLINDHKLRLTPWIQNGIHHETFQHPWHLIIYIFKNSHNFRFHRHCNKWTWNPNTTSTKLVCQVKFTSLSVGPWSPNRKEIILFSYPTTLAALTLIIYL